MSGINWNLLNPADVGANVMSAFERGQAMGEKAALRRAVSVFADNPDDPNALREVMAHDPQLGLKLAEYQENRAYRSALADYMAPGGQPNALLGVGGQPPARGVLSSPRIPGPGDQPPRPALNALAPVSRDASFGEAFAPLAAANQPPAPAQAQPDAAPQADLSFLGRPQSRQDAAFLRMVRTNPIEALKIQSAMRDNFMDRVKAEREYYTIAIEELSRVQDDAGWQAGIQRIAPTVEALGGDLSQIPVNYPGPEAVREMLEKALPAKEQLDYYLREANQEADNARADRNTDSQIDTREQRLRDQRAADLERLENQRRGQDLTDTRTRRGQDLTDRRQRDRPTRTTNSRGGTASPGLGRDNLPTVASPAQAMRLPKGTRFRTPDGQIKVRP